MASGSPTMGEVKRFGFEWFASTGVYARGTTFPNFITRGD
jgi:hypothetical protein